MNLKFYAIDENYMNYLRSIEKRIPYQAYYKEFLSDETNEIIKQRLFKPFIGIVFETENGVKYCTQISSPKTKHITMTEDIDFKKYYFENPITGIKRLIGVINFNYMFPVNDFVITEITASNLSKYRDFSSKDEQSKYWSFLQKQLSVINTHNWELDILTVYKRSNLTIALRSFDFHKLEKACTIWANKINKSKD